MLKLPDVDLADEGRDVLVVLVARLGLGDADLAQLRGVKLYDRELFEIAVEFVESLHRPRAEMAGQIALRDAVVGLQRRGRRRGVEQAERAFVERADALAGGQHVDRVDLHQRLEPLRERRLAPAHRAEQVEDLLALLEPLGGVAEEADDALDRLLHAVELGEGRVNLDRAVEEDAAEPGVGLGVDGGRLPDGRQHALRGCRIAHRVGPAPFEVFPEGHPLHAPVGQPHPLGG